MPFRFSRREALGSAAGLAGLMLFEKSTAHADRRPQPTKFQIACMTLPYAQFPLDRALKGIQSAGYRYVAWGTSHKEEGAAKPVPVMAKDAPPEKAKELARR